MSSGILGLVTFSTNNIIAHNNNIPNIAYESVQVDFEKINDVFKYTQLRNSDTIILDHLVFHFEDNVSMNDFMVFINNARFKLLFGHRIFWNLQLSLLANMEPPMRIGNKILIKLPFDILNKELNLLFGLNIIGPSNQITYYVDNFNNQPNIQLTNISMLAKWVFYDSPARHKLTHEYHTDFIQHIQSTTAQVNNTTNLQIDLSEFKFPTKGYFIEGNIDLIENIELKLHGHSRFNYNDILMSVYTKRINNNLLYIPFNGDLNNYKNPPIVIDYIGATNHTMIENITFHIRFNGQYNYLNGTNIKIHCLSANEIQYCHNPTGNYDVITAHGFNDVQVINTNNDHTVANPLFNQKNKQNTDLVWKSMDKILDIEKNSICPISLADFSSNDKYCVCLTCKCNFNYDAFMDYNSDNNTIKNCPVCRSPWNNFTIYTNIDPNNEIIDDPSDDISDLLEKTDINDNHKEINI